MYAYFCIKQPCFYKKNIQELRQSISSLKIESFCTQLEYVVEEYFSGTEANYRNAIRTLGLINEEIINSIPVESFFEKLGFDTGIELDEDT